MNAVVETINAAGRAFVDFSLPMLIQSTVLIVILLAVNAILRRKVRAVFRYWIWLLVLVKLVLPPSLGSPVSLGTWFGDKLEVPAASLLEPGPPQAVESQATELPPAISAILSPPNAHIAEPLMPETSVAPAEAEQPVVPETKIILISPAVSLNWQGLTLLVWLAVAIALILLLVQRAFFVRGLVGQAQEANRTMLGELEECRRRLGLRRQAGLRLSPNAAGPAVCGLLRPVILIPQTLAPRLHAHDLRAVLLHELAHVKRGDLWINLVQTLLQIAYFYNPLLWLANAMIRRTREQAVDEAVLVALGETARHYPETLVNIAKLAFTRRPALSLRLIGVVESKSALTARIKHILNRPLPKTARLGLIGAIAVLVTAAVLLPMARAAEGFASVDNKGPLDIRLVGVCPDGGDELYDADGRKLSIPMSYLGGHDSGPWDSDEQHREFVLQTPDLDQPVLFLPVWARAAGTDQTVGGGSIVFGGVEDASTLILPMTMDREYHRLGPKAPVARVDVPLRYFYGRPREALCTFTGPFLPGQTVRADQGRPYQLTPRPVTSSDGTVLEFHFTTDQPFMPDVPVILHDRQERRYLAGGAGGRSSPQGADLTYHLMQAVPWEEIAAVTVGEKPYEITFRNVAVRYPSRPPRSHAAYLDVMAQRLGLTGRSPEQLRQYTVKNPQEAIAVLDVVRGDWPIRTTFEALDRARPPINLAELDPATQQKIRQVAAQWAGSGSVSHYGIQLGLMGRWPEFFDLATDRLGSDYPTDRLVHQHEQRWREANGEIASALFRFWTEPSAPQVERIQRLILDVRSGPALNSLFICLRNAKSKEAIDALWALAQDDRPWIWWKALDVWYARTFRTRSTYDDLPEEIRVRLFLVKGRSDDQAFREKASMLLPSMFTPELGTMAREAWGAVREGIVREFDRETATRIYLDYLRRMQSAMTQRRWLVDFASRQESVLTTASVIRSLNVWYGINIGRLGTDETAVSSLDGPKTFSDFQSLIREALEWHRANRTAEPRELLFEGTVVDTAGRPVPMAQLSLTAMERDGDGYRSANNPQAVHARTDADGRFVFANLANTHHTLRVVAEGFAAREDLSIMQLPDGRFRISDGSQGSVIVLEKPASLSGRVIGLDGRPLANAKVHFWSYPTHGVPRLGQLVLDEQGRFTESPVMSGDHLVMYAERKQIDGAQEYEGVTAFNLILVAEGRAVEGMILDLRQSTATLEVEIVDRDGRPVAADHLTLEIAIPSGKPSHTSILYLSDVKPRSVHRFPNLRPMAGFLRVGIQGNPPKRVPVKLVANQTTRCRIELGDSTDRSALVTPKQTETQVVLPQADRGRVILDLATGELVPLPPAGPEPQRLQQALREMGKGDILYDVDLGDRTLILLRGATSEQVQEGTGEPGIRGHLINPQQLPEVLTVTTAESRRYEVTILSADEESCTLEHSLLPLDKGAGGGALVESGMTEVGTDARPSDPNLTARLPNGVTVELLAYSRLDEGGLAWWTPRGDRTTIPGVYEADVEGHGSLVALRIEPAPEAGVFAWSYQPPDVRRELKPMWRVNGSNIWLVPLGEGRSYVNLELMAKVRDPAAAKAVARSGFSLPEALGTTPQNIARITDVNRVDSDSTAFTAVVGPGEPRVVAALDVSGQVHSLRRAPTSEYAAMYGDSGRARYGTEVPLDRFAGIVVEGYSEREASMKLGNLSLRPGQPTQVRMEVAPQQQGPWWHRSEFDSLLESLGRALSDYAERSGGRYPPDLSAMRSYFEDTQWTWFQEHAVYLGAGKSSTQTDGVPLAYEKTLLPFGFGTYVLYPSDRVQFEIPEKLKELGIANVSYGSVAESQSSGADLAAVWQDVGEAIPADANDARMLAPGVVLDGIGQDVEGKMFVSILRDVRATRDEQCRFRVHTKDGQVLEPQYYLSLERDGDKLWEKFTFNMWYHAREIDRLSLQSRRAERGRKLEIPTARDEIATVAATEERPSPAEGAPPGRYALSFDGRGDYLFIPDSESLRTASSLTVEMWIKPQFPEGPHENRPGWGVLARGAYTGTGRVRIQGFGIRMDNFDPNEDAVLFEHCEAIDTGISCPGTYMRLPPDWVRVSETFSNTERVSAPGHPLVVGRFLIPTEDDLQGQIAEIRIWDGAKAGEMQRYEGKALTGAEPGLVACWTFEEGRGQIAHDISPNANHARLGRSVAGDDADPGWVDLRVVQSASKETSGQVLDPNGKPVAGAQVALAAEGKGVRILAGGLERQDLWSEPSIVTTDEQGRFAFSDVPAEYVLVVAHKTGFAQVEADALASSPILRLEPWGRVEGTLYIGPRAAEDQVVMLMGFVHWGPASWVNMSRTSVTTAGGRFVFETVPPGWCQIGLRAEMGRRYPGWTSRRSIRVPVGRTLEVTVGGTGRPVVGKFIPPRGYGKPVDFTWGMRVLTPVNPEVPLSIRGDEVSQAGPPQWWQTPAGRAWRDSVQHDPDRRLYAFSIEEDGTFRIEDVVPGKYEFTVLLTEGRYEGPEDYMASYRGAMEVPRMAEEYMGEPLDLGELLLDMRPSQSTLKSPSL